MFFLIVLIRSVVLFLFPIPSLHKEKEKVFSVDLEEVNTYFGGLFLKDLISSQAVGCLLWVMLKFLKFRPAHLKSPWERLNSKKSGLTAMMRARVYACYYIHIIFLDPAMAVLIKEESNNPCFLPPFYNSFIPQSILKNWLCSKPWGAWWGVPLFPYSQKHSLVHGPSLNRMVESYIEDRYTI